MNPYPKRVSFKLKLYSLLCTQHCIAVSSLNFQLKFWTENKRIQGQTTEYPKYANAKMNMNVNELHDYSKDS